MKRSREPEQKPDRDREGFERSYQKYNRALYGYIFGKGLLPADAYDLCQKVWFDVLKHPERIRQAKKPEAMLRRIAKDEIVDIYRKNSHQPENLPQSDSPEIESLPDPRDGRERRLELELEETLNALSEKHREMIELFMMQD